MSADFTVFAIRSSAACGSRLGCSDGAFRPANSYGECSWFWNSAKLLYSVV